MAKAKQDALNRVLAETKSICTAIKQKNEQIEKNLESFSKSNNDNIVKIIYELGYDLFNLNCELLDLIEHSQSLDFLSEVELPNYLKKPFFN